MEGQLAFDAAAFKASESEIKRELEREVASAVWGLEQGWRAFELTDVVIRKALETMPDSAKLLN